MMTGDKVPVAEVLAIQRRQFAVECDSMIAAAARAASDIALLFGIDRAEVERALDVAMSRHIAVMGEMARMDATELVLIAATAER